MKGEIYIHLPPELESKLEEIKKELEFLKTRVTHKPDELLTLEEAAKELKVDASTIYYWRKRKIISAESIGNRVYIRRSVIEAALQPLK